MICRITEKYALDIICLISNYQEYGGDFFNSTLCVLLKNQNFMTNMKQALFTTM